VYGPASATDNALARFDGTTGKLIQDSVVIVGDTGAVTGVTDLTASGSVTLSGGTANGVAYLNGSKVVTSGSALTFDGTNLGLGGAATSYGSTYSVLEIAGSASGVINVKTGSTLYGQISNSPNQFKIDAVGASTSLVFFTNSSEVGRFTSTGLGIGTSSPNTKLTLASDVSGGTDLASLENINSGANTTKFAGLKFRGRDTVNSGKDSAYIRAYPADQDYVGSTLTFWTRSSDALSSKMTLDSSGNLGLGVTPSAWASYRALSLGNIGSSIAGQTAANGTVFTSNAYYNAGWKYAATGVAAFFDAGNNVGGGFTWNQAASGTAGNAITFTQAMTLDADGDLVVGGTSANVYGISGKAITLNTPTGTSCVYEYTVNGTATGYFGGNASGTWVGAKTSIPIIFYTNDTERARIDSSGNLLVGTTTAQTGVASDAVGITLYGSTSLGTGVFTRNGIPLYVNNKNASGALIQFYCNGNNIGTISSDGTNTAYNTSSDYRLKNTIAPMTGALAKVALLKPVTYKWNADGSDGEGFIAHELAEVVPQCVTGEKDAVDEEGNPKYQGIDTSFLVATLTAALQEAVAKINSLEARLDAANL
jgi:hypothetical protein